MVRLISITPNCESTIVYCARVSSSNQDNPEITKLINYCVKNGHWSIFEMGNMIVEVQAPRYITAQILRHRSFSFQEFSQRYAKLSTLEKENESAFIEPDFRAKKDTNRQSSMETHPKADEYLAKTKHIFDLTRKLYKDLVDDGVAPETARSILPMCTMSKMYINGTIRSWIHYLQVRCDSHTQLEHQLIANQIKDIFKIQLPTIYNAIFE